MGRGLITTLHADQDLCLDQFLLGVIEITGLVKGHQGVLDLYPSLFLHMMRKITGQNANSQVLGKMVRLLVMIEITGLVKGHQGVLDPYPALFLHMMRKITSQNANFQVLGKMIRLLVMIEITGLVKGHQGVLDLCPALFLHMMRKITGQNANSQVLGNMVRLLVMHQSGHRVQGGTLGVQPGLLLDLTVLAEGLFDSLEKSLVQEYDVACDYENVEMLLYGGVCDLCCVYFYACVILFGQRFD